MASSFLPSTISTITQLINTIQSSLSSLPSQSSQHSLAFLKDLQHLSRVFNRIQAEVRDAVERDIQDESVKLWLSEIKDVAYDAEDVLDEFHYEVLRAQVQCRAAIDAKLLDSMEQVNLQEQKVSVLTVTQSDNLMKVLIESGMQERIKDIKEILDEISKARKNFWLGDEYGRRHSSTSTTYIPTPTTHQVKPDVRGRDIDTKKVVELLLAENDSKLSVVAIIGVGGIGKTTLAQLVFNDDSVSGYFDKRIWIYVHEDFDVVQIARTMVEDLTSCSYNINELSQLKKKLDQELKGKRLLLVLDDVWNERLSPWESLEDVLTGASTVQILVTTRNDLVTKVMKTVNLYRLGYLPETECWQLFKSCAFSGRDPNISASLVEIGQEIVKKCQGLPLAVKSLGCLLRHEDGDGAWNDVLQSELWDLPDEVEILPALKLSYKRMPSHLKSCFAYCSIFPKGHLLDGCQLTDLWIAQGFIQPKSGKSLEDTAKRYIDELLSRSLLEFNPHFPHHSYMKMHDKIHDLANYVSNGECMLIDGKTHCRGALHHVRHLHFKTSIEMHAVNHCILRTSVDRTSKRTGEMYTPTPESMIRLRALEFTFGGSMNSNFAIGNLKHLRYLHVKDGNMKELPSSICNLYKLQTLHLFSVPIEVLPLEFGNLVSLQFLSLKDCSKLKELPSTVGNLYNLQHLDLRNTRVRRFPASFWGLKNLEVIYTCTDGVQVNELEGMKDFIKLKVPLCISGIQNITDVDDAEKANLKSKHQIETLKLFWYRRFPDTDKKLHLDVVTLNKSSLIVDVAKDEILLEKLCPHAELKKLEILEYPGARYAKWMVDLSSFSKLTQVSLIGCRPPYLPSLGQLPFLDHLCLLGCLVRSIGKDFYCFKNDITRSRRTAFCSLRVIELSNLMELEEWYGMLDGDFPMLEGLVIHRCKSLSTLPSIRSSAMSEDHKPQRNLHAMYPSWTSNVSFTRLRDVTFENTNVACIPTLGQLSALERLSIRSCPVQIIGTRFCWSDSKVKRTVAFPALKWFVLEDLKELEMWYGVLDGDFPQLKDLIVCTM